MKIRKAVLPLAGIATRMLPASKVIPKMMLPLVDKPTVQYIVEEAVAAGIEEIIFVTNPGNSSIEDYFNASPELEVLLEGKGKKKDLVGNEPFVVMLGDNLVAPETPCLPRMIEIHERYSGSVLSLVSVPPEVVPTYGIAAVEKLGPDTVKVMGLIEKPSLEEAPSNLAVDGRYVITPDIFALLEETPPGRGGEIQLTDALARQAQAGHCFGLKFTGTRYDTGTPLGLLITSIAYGLKLPDIAPELREFMRKVLDER